MSTIITKCAAILLVLFAGTTWALNATQDKNVATTASERCSHSQMFMPPQGGRPYYAPRQQRAVGSPYFNADGYRRGGYAAGSSRFGGSSAYEGGNDYLSHVAEQGLLRWSPERLPLNVYVEQGRGVPGYRDTFPSMVADSLNEWVTASQNKLSWRRVNNPAQADITFSWVTNLSVKAQGAEAGRTETITRTNRRTGTGFIEKANVYVLTRLGNRYFSDSEVGRIVLHEAGHALGLQGHSPNRHDVMYYATTSGQSHDLTSRDRTTISKLYSAYPTSNGLAAAYADDYPVATNQGFPGGQFFNPDPTAYTPPQYDQSSWQANQRRATMRDLALEAAKRWLGGGLLP